MNLFEEYEKKRDEISKFFQLETVITNLDSIDYMYESYWKISENGSLDYSDQKKEIIDDSCYGGDMNYNTLAEGFVKSGDYTLVCIEWNGDADRFLIFKNEFEVS